MTLRPAIISDAAAITPGEEKQLTMPTYPHNPERAQTELMSAAYHGDAEEVARLLAFPCDIDAQDHDGLTALMYAALKGHTETVTLLIQHQAKLELQSAQRYTALLYAVRGGHTETVLALLHAKADPDVHGDYATFDTPLTLAAWQGFFPIVKALVAAGADVSLHGGYDQLTAECKARLEGHHEISEFLCYHEKRQTD